MEGTTTTSPDKDKLFFQRLRAEIDGYFQEKRIPKTGDARLYVKTGVLMTALVGLYVLLVFFTPASVWISLGLCAMLGAVVASIGFNVMHDGAHGSYSSKKWVNTIMMHSLEMLGGSSYLWKQKHNENHHTYTNVDGIDDDIDIEPLMRVHVGQKKRWFHRFQHFYSVFLYGFTYLFWISLNDLQKYFGGKVGKNTKLRKMKFGNHLVFWASKAFYVSVFILIPAWQVGLVSALVGYSFMVFVTGVIVSIVFQLAHVVEHSEFVHAGADPKDVLKSWAIHQVQTTANFATHNKLLSWYLGGLNFQIEHHLFPRISHVHYPAISQRFKAVCQEFEVPYREFRTTRRAIRAHFSHLRQVGMAA